MNIFRKTRAQNLGEWLEIATAKLSPDAKVRICTDIASHYNEAVDGHMEKGLSMSAAQAAALAELGNAKAAARRFRRTHLTQSEFRKVAKLLKSGRPGWNIHCGNLAGCLWFCLELSQRYGWQGSSVFWINIGVALFLVSEVVTFVLARHKNPRLLVLMASVSNLNFGILSLNTLIIPHLLPDTWIVLLLIMPTTLGWFTESLFYFRLRNKLGKVAEDWMDEAGEGRKEIPPEDPVAS